jgi:predicted ATP-grasp superfamily ATP-dependent carboligase
VIDKRRTLDLARRLDVPVPRTRTATAPQEAAQAAADVGWPVVLKPAVSPRYEPTTARMLDWPVSFAADAGQIERALRRYEGCPELLVQEYCPGTGLGVEMLVREGRPLAAFQHRRLAEIPVCGGASAWRESVPLDQELYEWSRRLVGALRWTGLIMVEFKKGRETRLMEINGRVWGSLPLALASGMDFPARLAGLCLGESPAADGGPDTRYRLGVRAYNLELALLWIIQVLAGRRRYRFLPGPRRREALAAAAGLLGPSSRFDVACRDDPRPGFAEIGKIARKLARKVREAAAPRRRHRDG